MEASVLVVTPSVGFGELIRQAIEKTGAVHALLATSGVEALEKAQTTALALCILDGDLVDVPIQDLWLDLRRLRPGLKLILIVPEDLLGKIDVQALNPDSLLNKPFYMPNLLAAIETILAPRAATAPSPAKNGEERETAPWLLDVSQAARYLTRLTLETAAQAALITRGDRLWAYAGELPQQAAQELAQAVAGFWADNGGGDLARFVRLEATAGEYMLYATGLPGSLVLALVFDARTPFSEMRAQAWRLARALVNDPGEGQPLDSSAGLSLDEGDRPASPSASGPQPESDSGVELPEIAIGFDRAEPPADLPVENPARAWSLSRASAEERFGSGTEAHNPVDRLMDQPAPALHQLTYACALIARLPHHRLSGEIAARLRSWLPDICLAYGWRLVEMAVHPECLQWLVKAPPDTPPAQLVTVVRQLTSRRIFESFPALEADNPSGDFWAPGQLILGSSHLPPEELLDEYIRRTRTWQGVSGPSEAT